MFMNIYSFNFWKILLQLYTRTCGTLSMCSIIPNNFWKVLLQLYNRDGAFNFDYFSLVGPKTPVSESFGMLDSDTIGFSFNGVIRELVSLKGSS